MVIADPEKIKWEPGEQLKEEVKGAWYKILSRDEETGAMAFLAKADKGFHERKHTDRSDCHVIVLEGKLVDEKGNEIKKVMYWFVPAGVEHGPIDVPEGCVLFAYINGPL